MKRIAIVVAFFLIGCARHPDVPGERAAAPVPSSSQPSVQPARTAPSPRDARMVVEEFGRRLKSVPLLAPRTELAGAIRENYGGLVQPSLLARWLNAPETAPGRRTSSPWPDRIEIESAGSQGPDRVTITGAVVDVSSAGEAGRTPIEVTLERVDGRWLISHFDRPAALSADERAAVDVIEQYYKSIAGRDFEKAYQLWVEGGPPGQSFAQFVAGYRDTATVEVTTGVPSRIGAAAGSRYIDVPVVVKATTTAGAKQRFEGSYTLRRSVVDGATPEQRAWHIYRASLH